MSKVHLVASGAVFWVPLNSSLQTGFPQVWASVRFAIERTKKRNTNDSHRGTEFFSAMNILGSSHRNGRRREPKKNTTEVSVESVTKGLPGLGRRWTALKTSVQSALSRSELRS